MYTKKTAAVLLLTGWMYSALAEPVQPLSSPSPAAITSEARVSGSFQDADLVYVLKLLAREAGCQVYVGPTVQGTVTAEFSDVPVDEALRTVVAHQANEYDFRLLDSSGHLVVVTSPDRLDEVCLQLQQPKTRIVCKPRMEYLLEHATSIKVVALLEAQFPDVVFTLHPTMNGFYASGSKDNLLAIKRELATLDRAP